MWTAERIEKAGSGERPLHLAIGVFDGVHLGHLAVLDAAREAARIDGGECAVLTFDPHPIVHLRPAMAPQLLTPTPAKLRLLEAAGMEGVILLEFGAELAQTSAADFARALATGLPRLRSIAVGDSWRFGHDRTGDVALLRTVGTDRGFKVRGVPPVSDEGGVVSSTRIRSALAAGDLALANRLLGRPFEIVGKVSHGQKRGRELGFPTANLFVTGLALPPDGVYAAQVLLADGSLHPAVVNLGMRPTIAGDAPVRLLEAHLTNFSGDLYDNEISVRLQTFLRPEMKFSSLDTLRQQIALDCAEAASLHPATAISERVRPKIRSIGDFN